MAQRQCLPHRLNCIGSALHLLIQQQITHVALALEGTSSGVLWCEPCAQVQRGTKSSLQHISPAPRLSGLSACSSARVPAADRKVHPNRAAPRCLPCGYQDPLHTKDNYTNVPLLSYRAPEVGRLPLKRWSCRIFYHASLVAPEQLMRLPSCTSRC